MKKFVSVVMLAVILAMGAGSVALAQDPTATPIPPTATPTPPVAEPVPDDFAPPTAGVPTKGAELLDKVKIMGDWVFAVLLAISIIFIVVAAFEFVTGQGNAEKMTGARQKIIYAAIGIGVALIATGIDDVLRSIIGVE